MSTTPPPPPPGKSGEDKGKEKEKDEDKKSPSPKPAMTRSAKKKGNLKFFGEKEVPDLRTKATCDKTLPDFPEDKDSVKWKEPFFFIQAADTQFGMMDNWGDGTYGEDQYPKVFWDEEVALCKKAINKINEMEPKPKFMVICGDLVDRFPDGRFEDHRRRQIDSFKEVFANLDKSIKLVCVCGNHDVGNDPTPETVNMYRTEFGFDYFSFWVDGVCFIALNSQYFVKADAVLYLAAEHEEWIEAQLENAREKGAKHVVIFQHIPWFHHKYDEKKDYFNIEKNARLQWLDTFHAAGVRKIFCGHYHRNAGGFYKDLEVIVTTAVGCQLPLNPGDQPSGHGMRVVKVGEESISHHFHLIDDLPVQVQLS